IADYTTNGGTLEKLGAGTVVINRAVNYRLALLNPTVVTLTKVQVSAGTLVIDNAVRSTAHTSNVRELTIAAGASLDLGQNNMVIDYAPPSGSGTPIPIIRALLRSAFDNGTWDKPGLTSANARAAATQHPTTALGYAEAA